MSRPSATIIQEMFARVQRDAPGMDGVNVALFTARVFGIDPLEVWLAVDGRFIFDNPETKIDDR